MANIPTTRDDLLVAALLHADKVSGLLNDISAGLYSVLGDDADNPKWDKLYGLLRTRFEDNSSLGLFVAAENIGVDLPEA